jgi:hypothetical protein
MAEGVTYAIDVLYRAQDKASAPLREIAKHADLAARRQKDFSSALHGSMARNRTDQIKRWFGSIRDGARGAQSPLSGLTGAIGGLAAGVGAFGALALGKKAFIDFNSSVEMSTISIAAQEKMLLGGRWSDAMSNATGLFKEYQSFASKSIGETKDFLDMHAGIASSAYRAGLGMKDLTSMTKGATVAAIALGERADMVSLDIKQMLAGDVTSRDRTAQILLASQGISQEKFNKLGQQQRNKIIMSALNDPALKDAAKAYGNTFSGAMSAFKDNLSITMGKVGLPLFKAVTKEVQRWNAWIEKNPDVIARFAKDFSSALMDGFRVVKDAMSWVVENKGLLLKLAEAALVMKGASMAGGLLRGAAGLGAGGVGGAVGRAALAAGGGSLVGLNGWQTALVGATAALGPFGAAVSAAAIGVGALAKKVDKEQDARILRDANASVLRDNITRFRAGAGAFDMRDPNRDQRLAMQVLRAAQDAGAYSPGKGLSREGAYRALYGDNAGAAMMANMGRGTPEAEQLFADLTAALDKFGPTLSQLRNGAKDANAGLMALGSGLAKMWNDPLYGGGVFGVLGRMMNATAQPLTPGDAKKDQKPEDKKIEINMPITVVSNDADRFAVTFAKAARMALKNPRGARRVIREG